MIANKWAFFVSCLLLRIFEGVGTSLVSTTIFASFPKLFPKAVGTLVVSPLSGGFSVNIHYIKIVKQGLFELSSGLGYSLGPSIGGAMYQVSGLATSTMHFSEPCIKRYVKRQLIVHSC